MMMMQSRNDEDDDNGEIQIRKLMKKKLFGSNDDAALIDECRKTAMILEAKVVQVNAVLDS